MLRTAIAPSALTGKTVRVRDIDEHGQTWFGRAAPLRSQRRGDDLPGTGGGCLCWIDPDHLRSGKGDARQSQVGRWHGRKHHLGTPGLLACFREMPGRDQAHIVGGTNVRWSPPIDFYERLLFPKLSAIGFQLQMTEMRRGFYPEGGGIVGIRSQAPRQVAPITLVERGNLLGVEGLCFSQNLPEHVCQRANASVRKEMLGFDY